MDAGSAEASVQSLHPLNQDSVAAYIADLVGEMSTMAHDQRLSTLAYILAMAQREAEACAKVERARVN